MKLLNWIGRALSEQGEPSSKRVISFLFALVVCFGVCFAIITKTQNGFQQYLFVGLLVAIFLLLGVATVPQIVQLWKGGGNAEVKETTEEEVKP